MSQLVIPHDRPQALDAAGPPARTRARRRARWWQKLLLAAGALAVSLAVLATAAEIYLRGRPGASAFAGLSAVYDFNENDGRGSIRTIPDYRGVKVVEGRLTHVRLNNLGMRGPDVGAKRGGELRVLVLGDSMAFGHGVEDYEAFPALLERALEDALGRDVTVGNAGVPGNAHCEHVRDLERHAPAFRPDLVLSCVYTGNDFDGDFFGPKRAIEGYYFDTQTARFLESSWRARLALRSKTAFVVEKFLENHLPALAIDRSAIELTPEEAGRYAGFTMPRTEGLFMDALEPEPIVGEVLERMERNLGELRRVAGGAPVLTVVLPSFVQTWPGVHAAALEANGMDPQGYRRGLGPERFRRRCEELGMPCLDLTPVMAAHEQPGALYLPTDLHFSVAGHAFVAAELAPWVAGRLRSLKTVADATAGGG